MFVGYRCARDMGPNNLGGTPVLVHICIVHILIVHIYIIQLQNARPLHNALARLLPLHNASLHNANFWHIAMAWLLHVMAFFA